MELDENIDNKVPLGDEIIVLLNKLELNKLKFSLAFPNTSRLQFVNNSEFILTNEDSSAILTRGKWHLLGEYMVVDGPKTMWRWVWNMFDDSVVQDLQNNISNKLDKYKQLIQGSYVLSDDPMFMSFLMAILTDKLDYEYMHVIGGNNDSDNKFVLFGLKNIEWPSSSSQDNVDDSAEISISIDDTSALVTEEVSQFGCTQPNDAELVTEKSSPEDNTLTNNAELVTEESSQFGCMQSNVDDTLTNNAELVTEKVSPEDDTLTNNAELVTEESSPVDNTLTNNAELVTEELSPVDNIPANNAELITEEVSPEDDTLTNNAELVAEELCPKDDTLTNNTEPVAEELCPEDDTLTNNTELVTEELSQFGCVQSNEDDTLTNNAELVTEELSPVYCVQPDSAALITEQLGEDKMYAEMFSSNNVESLSTERIDQCADFILELSDERLKSFADLVITSASCVVDIDDN
jgi:hypothetical protein